MNSHISSQLYIFNRIKILEFLNDYDNNSVLFLRGGLLLNKYNTDNPYSFQQESNFRYIFGVNLPNCYGLLHTNSLKTILFIDPKYDNLMYKIVNGEIPNIKNIYNIHNIFYINHIHQYFINNNIKKVYIIDYPHNNNNNIFIPKINDFLMPLPNFNKINVIVDNIKLYNIFIKSRVIKSTYEISIMKYINNITSMAHLFTIYNSKPGMYEFQLHYLFCYYLAMYGGIKNISYNSICSSGTNTSILHYDYNQNNKIIRHNDLILMDMGAEYYGYISDITTTFPINKQFNYKQKIIYYSVLSIFQYILKLIKPNINWLDIAYECNKLIVLCLLKYNFIKGTFQQLMHYHIYQFFMPHKLAHFIGLDVHDVGDLYNEFNILKPGMILAVEPGLYFNKNIIQYIQSSNIPKYLFNLKKIYQYISVGGVRLESNILITSNGSHELTIIPRNKIL
jgi:Xaa-Pro dipeptidase